MTHKGRLPLPFCLDFYKVYRGGAGLIPIKQFMERILYILEGFWQHKIDIKRLFEVRIVTN